MSENDEVPCSTHPDAPHGFNRNASHTEDRYVCDCEGWKPPAPDPLLDQASQEDIEAAARAMALVDGWNGWDTASGFNDTLSGNDPEDERAHYRDLATAALSAYDARRKA